MCFECDGRSRKPITTPEDFAIYLEGGGGAWKQVEREEVAACKRARLGAIPGASKRLTGGAGKPRPAM